MKQSGESGSEPDTDANAPCCAAGSRTRPDMLLVATSGLIILALVGHGLFADYLWVPLAEFCRAVVALIAGMWWGILIGIFFIGALNYLPRQWIMKALRPGGVQGILRAAVAGLAFDMCNHGILLIAAKLYERGASLGQMIAFLIASPWNSLSLSIILVSLIGWGWTLAIIGLSFLVAVVSGLVFERLGRSGLLPLYAPGRAALSSPAQGNAGFPLAEARRWRHSRVGAFREMMGSVFSESGMLLRWLFLGVLLAALLQVALDAQAMTAWFGPTMSGLGLTLLAATLLEVCSEGATPIAADFFARAQAPGNGFVFLMAGAATDYTEIMVLRQATSSWRAALFMPLIALPQIILIGVVLNGL